MVYSTHLKHVHMPPGHRHRQQMFLPQLGGHLDMQQSLEARDGLLVLWPLARPFQHTHHYKVGGEQGMLGMSNYPLLGENAC